MVTKYKALFRIRFTNGIQYRVNAFAGILTQFAWGFMTILLFRAFYRAADPATFPMEFSQLCTYIWLQQAFWTIFMLWFVESEIFEAITSGAVAYELARPMDLYSSWFVKSLAGRVARAALRSLPILIVAAILPAPYGLTLPASWAAAGLFVISGFNAALLTVAFSMFVYIATIYTLSLVGMRVLGFSLTEFLTGAIIPLPFLPDGVRHIVELLPFASMQNLPFLIYNGSYSPAEAVSRMVLQAFWLAFLWFIGRVWMKKALRRAVVQGG